MVRRRPSPPDSALVRNKRAVFDGLFDGTTDEVRFDTAGGFLSHVHQVMTDLAPPARRGDTDAADEAEDLERAEATIEKDDAAVEDQHGAVATAGAPAEQALRAVPLPSGESPALDVGLLRRALRDVRVDRTPAGALRIEASGDAAHVLAELFGTMARLLAG